VKKVTGDNDIVELLTCLALKEKVQSFNKKARNLGKCLQWLYQLYPMML